MVHISSIAAQGLSLLIPLYIASKAAISGFVRSLRDLENPPDKSIHPIRVTAVAPGTVRTPLWLDNPEKLAWFSETQNQWITPEEVAERMLDLVVKKEYVGGTVLEVGAGHSRKVERFNDPGPSGPGMASSNSNVQEVWDKLDRGWGQIYQN